MKFFSIILILLTILVPSMLGYVKKSQEVRERTEAHQIEIDEYAEEYYDRR